MYGIQIRSTYINTHRNEHADALSRGDLTSCVLQALTSPAAGASPVQGFAAKRRMSGINLTAPLPLGIFSPQQAGASRSPRVLAASNVNVQPLTASPGAQKANMDRLANLEAQIEQLRP